MKSYLHMGLAVLAGAAMSLSFAPFELWWVAPVCIGCLYAIIQSNPSKRAAWLGYLFGVGYFGVGVSWVYNSLHVFGGASPPIGVMLTAFLVLFLSLYPCLATYVFRRLTRIQHARMTVFNAAFFGAVWSISELLRAKILGGFPWILIGYSQTSGPLGSLAPIIGVYGIGFVLVFWSVLLTTIAVPKQPLITRIGSIVAFVAVPVLGIALSQLSFSTPTDEPFKVRIVQANIPQELKFSKERLKHSIEEYTSLSLDAEDDTDLILWPETAIPTYFRNIESTIAPFVQKMSDRGIDVLSGGFYHDDGGNYNAVRQLGGEKAVYQKRHLVPFGEYVPFRFAFQWFSSLVTISTHDLSVPSTPVEPMVIGDTPLGLSICYEDTFGEEMRVLLPESTVLVNVSNDAWFGDSFAPHQHEQKARMRAREFSRPMVRATNTGVSSFIDEKGNVFGRIPLNKQGVLDRTVIPQQGQTPYAATGNWPIGIFSLIIIAISGGLHNRRCRVQYQT